MSIPVLDSDNTSSPYYLHPSENPSLILVSPPLNGQNYHSWYRSMRMCLLSKNKLKFVDGSIAVPPKDSQIYPVWERCNTMVLSWLLRSLSPSIAQSILWLDNAMDVWKDLFDRFSQGNAVRVAELQEEIYGYKQNNLSVTDFFTQLKILWDEYTNLRSVPICSCHPQCSCNALKTVKDYQESDYVIRFLKGLSENYAVVKSQVLMMEPLPKINRVFSLALQHERQLGLSGVNGQIIEPSVFAAQAVNSYQRRPTFNSFNNRSFRPPINNFGSVGNSFRPQGGQKKFYTPNSGKPICSHCGASGHTIDICFKKHGYPPGFTPRFRPQNFVNQVGEVITEAQESNFYMNQDQFMDQYGNTYNNSDYYNDNSAGVNTKVETGINNQDMIQSGMSSQLVQNGMSSQLAQNGTNNQMHNPPVFTQEQYSQIMNMLHQNNNNQNSESPRINTVSTNFSNKVEHEGTQFLSYSYFKNFTACSYVRKPVHDVRKPVYENLSWIIDSGATDHIVCSLNQFTSYTIVHDTFVTLPNSQRIAVTHVGTVKFSKDFILHNVLFVPEFAFNLISTSKLTAQHDICLIIHKNVCIIQDIINWKMIGLAKQIYGLYYLDKDQFRENNASACVNSVGSGCLNSSGLIETIDVNSLWHFRLGHLSNDRLKCLQNIDSSIKIPANSHCKTCHLSKQKKIPFPISKSVVINCFDLIHIDIWGPARIYSLYGHKYFLTIVDDKSRFTWLFLLKAKSEARTIIQNFCMHIETQFNTKIKCIRSDNGLEFHMPSFYDSKGIIHQTTCVYTPEQNSVVERKHQHILNVARSLKFQALLPLSFWSDCVSHAVYLINRVPSLIIDNKTPFQILYNKDPSFENLKVFGCVAYASTISNNRCKFSPRATECIFLGFPSHTKGFRLYDIKAKQVIVSRNVRFYEHLFHYKDKNCMNESVDCSDYVLPARIDSLSIDVSLSSNDLNETQSTLVGPNLEDVPVSNISEINPNLTSIRKSSRTICTLNQKLIVKQ
ncbi:uncharacterized protein LOC126668656 [Mercurialis annua]|uniref:uncharacterized protein LOC126668656 n=1 Tax=Mercurialis annua TaxID=3986 RepID=UPI00215F6D46|nr:uncharacterized protein LOC126668656 [Mercurialis annua]